MNGDKESVRRWLDLAVYDMKTAESLLMSKRYPYALFLCHLAIEKILKAHVVRVTKKHAPYTHNLVRLADLTAFEFSEQQKQLIVDLVDFNIEARYPDWKRGFYARATASFTKQYVTETKYLFVWLTKSLKK